MITVNGIDHVAITVRDVEKSAAWYHDILGLEKFYEGAWGGIPVMIGKGTTCLALFSAKNFEAEDVPGTGTIDVRHIAFKADGKNFKKAQKILTGKNIEFEFQDHEIAHSIYFKDPDGYRLEITTYEI